MTPDTFPLWKTVAPFAAFVSLALLCRIREMPLLRIVLACCLALIGYACLQDQFSARLCPEYFTVGHGHLPLPSWVEKTPTALALVWGFLAGFPGGIMIGIPTALVSNLGALPRLTASSLGRPLLGLVLFMAIATLIAGASGAYNAQIVNIRIGAPWDTLVPPEHQRAFFIVACAHFGSYLGAAVGCVGLCGWIIRTRYCLQTNEVLKLGPFVKLGDK